MVKTVWFFFKPYKYRALVIMVLSLLGGLLEAATVAAIYPILNAAFSSGAQQSNIILTIFHRLADALPISDTFISYCVMFMGTAVLSFVIKLLNVNLRIRLGAAIVAHHQSEIFERYLKADYQYFIDHKQGELLYNATNAPQQLPLLIFGVTEFFSQMILSLSVILLLFSLSWAGALAVLVLAVGYQWFSRGVGRRIAYRSSLEEQRASRETDVILNETITGIKQVKVYTSGDQWLGQFRAAVSRRWHYYARRNIWGQTPALLLFLVLYLGIGTIVLVIKLTNSSNFMTLIPVFGAFAFALFRLVPFISTVGSWIQIVLGALPDTEVVKELQERPPGRIKDGTREMEPFRDEIRFENVSYSHKTRARTIDGISMAFKRGQTTAIVGRSGSGKTTLINLMLRLFDVDEGAITVDGVDVRDLKLVTWLRRIGYVSQDTFIMNDTVRNNLTFWSDQYSDEDIVEATRTVDAHDFITQLPQGYDTVVGDKGTRLSGGQAQRIALARAMVRDPEILIFDEATNNLDTISETAVQRAIEKISGNRTVITIAHRLSTVVNADNIIVLEDGTVAEQGTHAELLERRGVYWDLRQHQDG